MPIGVQYPETFAGQKFTGNLFPLFTKIILFSKFI
jgi:hypothetical protein